jgi:hypothetical protein
MGIEAADLVVFDLAYIGGAREIRNADNGVVAEPPDISVAGPISAYRSARLVDQRHAALVMPWRARKPSSVCTSVENRIADPEHVVFCVSHLTVLLGHPRKAGPIMTSEGVNP